MAQRSFEPHVVADRVWRFLSSLELTVVLLALGIVLVFIGTIAQVDEGLYQAQARYFRQWIVWGIGLYGHEVPVPLPGGYLLGVMLLANLVAAHVKRFAWSFRKLGIHLTHAGIVLLLLGQLTTDMFSQETLMRFAEGETRNYTESPTRFELAFTRDLDDGSQDLVSIPSALLARGGEVRPGGLPCSVRAKSYWPNSEPSFRAPQMRNGPALAENGVGRSFDFRRLDETRDPDLRNVPTAVVEIEAAGRPLGTWVASAWASDESLVSAVRDGSAVQVGPELARQIAGRLAEPQAVEIGGDTWTFALRPERSYKPFAITLLKTTHKVYPGTDIPRDFRSRVRIENPATGEDREAEIFMNNPLRYGGLAFYQFQMGREDLAGGRGTSTLQVVRNPSWLAPYLGCLIVCAGLIVQFTLHLVGFVSKRRPA